MTAPAFAPAVGRPPSIELLPPADLRIDESYQRAIASTASQALINRIAREWDWRLCVPLLVSRRTDGLFVIDGQHRLHGAIRRGDIPYLPACVSSYGSVADEAAIFVAANRRRRAVVRVDTFRAALLAGDENAAAIAGLLDRAGLRLARASGTSNLEPGELNCIVALERSLAQHGAARLGEALGLIGKAFVGERLAHGAPIVQAVCATLADRELAGKRGALLDTLRRYSDAEWHERARATTVGPNGGQTAVWAMKRAIVAALDEAGPRPMLPPPPARIAPAVFERPSAPTETAPVFVDSTTGRRPGAPKVSFEEQMAGIAAGRGLVKVEKLRKPDPEFTQGGVGSAML